MPIAGLDPLGDAGGHFFRFRFGFMREAVPDLQPHQAAVRGIPQTAALVQFAGIEGGIVVTAGSLDDVIFGLEGLKDHSTTKRRAPGATGDLGEQVEGPFGCEGIGESKTNIGEHDAHQGHQRKIETFGKHLRANENVSAVSSKVAQDNLVRILGAGGFPVPAQGAGFWKEGFHFRFHFFTTKTIGADVRAPAIRAFDQHAALVATMMTDQGAGRFHVQGQGGIAARAAGDVTTVTAKNIGGGAAPVEKQDGLLIFFQDIFKGIQQGLAEHAAVAGFQFLAHIDHAHRR